MTEHQKPTDFLLQTIKEGIARYGENIEEFMAFAQGMQEAESLTETTLLTDKTEELMSKAMEAKNYDQAEKLKTLYNNLPKPCPSEAFTDMKYDLMIENIKGKKDILEKAKMLSGKPDYNDPSYIKKLEPLYQETIKQLEDSDSQELDQQATELRGNQLRNVLRMGDIELFNTASEKWDGLRKKAEKYFLTAPEKSVRVMLSAISAVYKDDQAPYALHLKTLQKENPSQNIIDPGEKIKRTVWDFVLQTSQIEGLEFHLTDELKKPAFETLDKIINSTLNFYYDEDKKNQNKSEQEIYQKQLFLHIAEKNSVNAAVSQFRGAYDNKKFGKENPYIYNPNTETPELKKAYLQPLRDEIKAFFETHSFDGFVPVKPSASGSTAKLTQ